MSNLTDDQELSQEQQELLELLMAREAEKEADDLQAIPRQASGHHHPLSFTQQRLWFLEQLEPGTPLNNIPQSLLLEGSLDRPRFEQATVQLMQRHEILRTAVVQKDGVPTQHVDHACQPALSYEVCPCPPGEERNATLWEMSRQECLRPFQLDNAPLWRLRVVRLDDTTHAVFFTVHHLIFDGWSMVVFIRDLIALYQDAQGTDLPPLPIQYADFAIWQRKRWESGMLEHQLAHWESTLKGAPQILNLPKDKPASADVTLAGTNFHTGLSPELSAKTIDFCKQQGITEFMLFEAVFGLMLAVYSGQKDILIGTPVANRNRPEVEPLIGYFVNTLVLRNDMRGDIRFEDYMERMRQVILNAFDNQDLPFEKVVDRLQPQRALQHTPLFQVFFVYQNVPKESLSSAGLAVKPLPRPYFKSAFDMALSMSRDAEGIVRASIEYKTDHFHEASIAGMFRTFEQLLATAMQSPTRALHQLDPLTTEDRKKLLQTWVGKSQERPKNPLIHKAFERSAQHTPDAIALVQHTVHISYACLNQSANHIALGLLSKGMAAGHHVGLVADKHPSVVATFLGLWKIGATVIPIAADSPPARRHYMLTASKATFYLVRSESDLTQTPEGIDVLRLADVNQPRDTNKPFTPPDTDLLAYILFTSGSTGKPKGVAVSHRAITNRFLWADNCFPMNASDRMVQLAAFTFDIAIWELLAVMAHGGTTVLADPDVYRDPHALAKMLAEQYITQLHLVPTMLNLLLETDHFKNFSKLKCLYCGGETVRPTLKNHVLKHFNVDMHHFYGPTEAAINVTHWFCDRDRQDMPIGRPIDNTAIYLLDRHGRLVPPGAIGEVFIAGSSLAQAYAGQPSQTAARFLPNPFGEPGARFYASGDLARFLPDSPPDSPALLAFQGRVDHQLKWRGRRIEPGEIAYHLTQRDDVREAAIVIHRASNGKESLVAFIEASPDHPTPQPRTLLKALREQIPDYMVPNRIVVLPEIPLSPTGKIDRKQLAVTPLQSEDSQSFRPPRNQTERLLCDIWSALLNVPKVGIDDNFFGLGGDSILSIQVVAKARRLGLNLHPKTLFQHQTIAELAQNIEQKTMPSIPQDPITGPIALTPVQLDFLSSRPSLHFNQALLFQTPANLDCDQIRAATRQLVRHHDLLRARFLPEPIQAEIVPPADMDGFTYHDLSHVPAKEQTDQLAKLLAQLHTSFHWNQVPLFRVCYLNLGASGRLVFLAHHLLVDGVTWRILLEDFQALMTAENIATVLPPKTTAFSDWVTRLQQAATTGDFNADHNYWDRIASLPLTPCPLDHLGQNEANTIGAASSVTLTLNDQLSHALLRDANKGLRTRTEDLLLTGLGLTLAQWSGHDTLLVDMESHGRNHSWDDIDLSRTAGWFTAPFPLALCDLDPKDPLTTLKKVKEQRRQVPHDGLSFGALRAYHETLGPKLQQMPSAWISFNYLGQVDKTLRKSGILQAAPESSGTAIDPTCPRERPFDLTIVMAAGKFQLSLTYSPRLHDKATAQALLNDLHGHLSELAHRCKQPENFACTPSDFPMVRLEQSELDHLMNRGIEAQNLVDILPLSPTQQGLLFHTLRSQGSGVYFSQLCCTLHGDLQIAVFQEAWAFAIAHFDALRTSFHWEDLSEPIQIVHQHVTMPWEHDTWHITKDADRIEKLNQYLDVNTARGVDLCTPPLMRGALFQFAPHKHQFVWSHHHLLLDGWSIPILIRTVMEAYQALIQGHAPQAPITRSYRDFIAWIYRQDRNQARQFWRDYLTGVEHPTPVPGDRGVSSDEAEKYAKANLRLPQHSAEAIQQYARQHRLTVNTLVQGVWSLILSRYSGPRKVMYGNTVSGRSPDLHGVESMVGLFINTLPITVEVTESMPVVDWLHKLQAQQTEALDYAYLPLPEIQSESAIPSGQGLFESILVFENYPVNKATEEAAPTVELSDIHSVARNNFPLTLLVSSGRNLLLSFSFDARRFESTTMAGMLDQVAHLLDQIAGEPACKVSDLQPLTADQRQALLTAVNDTARDYPGDRSVIALFRDQVAQSPDRVVLTQACGEAEDHSVGIPHHLTYAALDRRSDAMATLLTEYGVGPDMPVAMCLERENTMVAAILGTLKTGAHYLPLDPAWPNTFTGKILSRAHVSVLVTHESLLDNMPAQELNFIATICPETVPWTFQSVPIHHAPLPSDLLAYIMFTSGSTGEPKGVMISHRAILGLIFGNTFADLSDRTRMAAMAPTNFDASTLELWAPLLLGGTCILFPERVPQPERAGRFLARHHINTMWLTSSLLRLFLEEQPSILQPVRHVLTGGEHPPEQHIRSAANICPETRFYNGYGPTESTTFASVYPIPTPLQATPVPIGTPLGNTTLYVLDRNLSPTPYGIVGDLYIGGVGLARGYLARPAETASRFVPHPQPTQPGERLYHTGDRVLRRHDHHLVYVGRRDAQVKVRGFRIEIGEIESHLTHHPDIANAAVVVKSEPKSGKSLVAFIALTTSPDETKEPINGLVMHPTPPDESHFKTYLRQSLPSYMVPSHWVFLAQMPLTRTGKVNRTALKRWDPADHALAFAAEQGANAPTTDTERKLAAIWSDVLGLTLTDIHANFFDLGGHSLTATQVLSRVRKAFNTDVPLEVLFETPTVADLRDYLENQDQTPTTLPPMTRVLDDSPPPVSYAQQRLWLAEKIQDQGANYNVPAHLQLKGHLDVPAFEAATHAMIHRHESLRTTFAEEGGEAVQIIHPEPLGTLSIIDLVGLSAEERTTLVKRLAKSERNLPFILERGPLLRTTLLRESPQQSQLLWTMHHIVSDAWSVGIMLREFTTLYRDIQQKQALSLPKPTFQFRDYARWQRRYLDETGLANQRAFWQDFLADAPDLSTMPSDFARPEKASFDGEAVSIALTPALSNRITHLLEHTKTSPFIFFEAAFAALLSHYTGQTDVIIGASHANRNRLEMEKLVGFFVNTLPMRNRIEQGISFLDFLRTTQTMILHVFQNQDLSFDQMVALSNAARVPGANPLFQILFIFQNTPTHTTSLPGLTATPVNTETIMAKFDMTLQLWEAQDGTFTGNLVYATDLFQQDTMNTLIERFIRLLETITEDPKQPINEYNLFLDHEQNHFADPFSDDLEDDFFD